MWLVEIKQQTSLYRYEVIKTKVDDRDILRSKTCQPSTSEDDT